MRRFFPTSRALRWAFATVAVVVAALVGNQWGAYRERNRVATELTQNQRSLATIEEQYQRELAELRTQRDIADASNKALQESLKQIKSEALAKQSAQRLYERIEGTDVSSGLGVDTVTKVVDENGEPKELHITVIQARGRERVKGRIGVALLGEKDGSNWREVIVEASSQAAPRFDMRFFQTLVVPLPELDILIDLVEIDVNPDGKRHKPVNYEADWAAVRED